MTSSKSIPLITFFILSVFILTPCSLLPRIKNTVSLAEDRPGPEIYDFTVSNSRDRLLAYFSLKNGCPPYVQIALESGVIVRYIYEVELQAPRFLLKKRLSRVSISRTLSYDNLKGEYRVSFGPDSPRVVSVRTLEEAKSLAFEINDVSVISLSELPRGKTYIMRVRAKTEKAVSSLPFRGLLDLFSSWGYRTKWYEIRFNY
ncbi:MAG: DUF4390 domain-containing protein [Dissulfuribacterales bacterium]